MKIHPTSLLRLSCLLLLVAGCSAPAVTANTPPCAAPKTQCGDECVDLTVSASHCGSCEKACATSQICTAGACGCGAGQQDKNSDGICEADCVTAKLDCSGHGKCDDSNGKSLCLCDATFAGATCASCADGFQDNDKNKTCERTCVESKLTCGIHGSCSDATGTPKCVCAAGFSGSDCSTCAAGYQDRDKDGICAPDCATAKLTCSSHGTCADTTGAAACTCDTGYAGADCKACAGGYQDNDKDGTCKPSCPTAALSCNAGQCSDASGNAACVCNTGYSGGDCKACATGYQDKDGNGTCLPGCATAALSCNGGTCDDASGSARCFCIPGAAGAGCTSCAAGFQDNDGNGTCQKTCTSAALTCSNQGVCVDASGTASCACAPGYSGSDCKACAAGFQDKDGNGSCLPTCAGAGLSCNAGTCADTTGVARCTCNAGYAGADCSTCTAGFQDNDANGTCSAGCALAALTCGGGSCADASGTAKCVCPAGQTGADCKSCAAGYQDKDANGVCLPDCATAALTCSSHGTCADATGTATCGCAPGYAGSDCSACAAGFQDNDKDGTCSASCATAALSCNTGVCSDTSGTAACNCNAAGYTGADCKSCATGYQDKDGNGSCLPTCATAALSCAGGTCDDSSGSARCNCPAGTTGSGCTSCAAGFQDNDNDGTCKATCTTANLSCAAGKGVCVDASGTATCSCSAGYTGPTCTACATGYQDKDSNGSCLPTCATAALTCPSAKGTCADTSGAAKCVCITGYAGVDCTACAAGYQDNDNNGTCTGTCATAALTCLSGAVCADTSGTARCVCGTGFQDKDNNGTCEATCATSGLACANGGSCADTTGTPKCTCTLGYTGPNCSACAIGFQDNDRNGTCNAACSATTTCRAGEFCNDASGTAICTPGANPFFTLVYDLNLPNSADWNVYTDIPYTVDNSGKLGAYDRIGYLLELDGNWVWTEMDDFAAGNLGQTGVPIDWIFKKAVTNLTVTTNVAAVTPVTSVATGAIEFWSNCYDPGLNNVYDYDDNINLGAPDCHGSMQVFNATKTLFACNDFSEPSTIALGIGNNTGNSNPDWTFMANAPGYAKKRLRVYARTARASCLAWQKAGATSNGIYRIDPDGAGPIAAFDAYCDQTSDGGGWTLVYKNDLSGTGDRTDSGFNVGALTNPTLNAVAILPRATLNSIGSEFRLLTATPGRSFYYVNAPFYTTDNHTNVTAPNVQAKLTYAAAYAPGQAFFNVTHGICITSAANGSTALEHICDQRYCCGTPNAGLWFNGGAFPAGYNAGTAWVR